MVYTVETTLTQELHDDVYKKWYWQHVMKPYALRALWFPPFYLAALALLKLGVRVDEAFISGFFVAMLCAYAHWFYWISSQSKAKFGEMARFYTDKSIKHEFNDEGFVVTDERSETFFPWNEVTGYEDYDGAWRLSLGRWDNMLLPTEKLTDEMKRFIHSHLFT